MKDIRENKIFTTFQIPLLFTVTLLFVSPIRDKDILFIACLVA